MQYDIHLCSDSAEGLICSVCNLFHFERRVRSAFAVRLIVAYDEAGWHYANNTVDLRNLQVVAVGLGTSFGI